MKKHLVILFGVSLLATSCGTFNKEKEDKRTHQPPVTKLDDQKPTAQTPKKADPAPAQKQTTAVPNNKATTTNNQQNKQATSQQTKVTQTNVSQKPAANQPADQTSTSPFFASDDSDSDANKESIFLWSATEDQKYAYEYTHASGLSVDQSIELAKDDDFVNCMVNVVTDVSYCIAMKGAF